VNVCSYTATLIGEHLMRTFSVICALMALSLASASAETKGSSSSKQFAPGQRQTEPGDAKRFAPGQKQNSPGDAKDFAPGQQGSTTPKKKSK